MMHLRSTSAKVFRRHIADDVRVVDQDIELAPFGHDPFNDLQWYHKCGVSECP